MRLATVICVTWLALPASVMAAPDKLIVAGQLLDVRSGKLQADQAILLQQDRVHSIVPVAKLSAAQQALPRTDLSGYTLLPGLIDMHVHLTANPAQHGYRRLQQTPARQALFGVTAAQATLQAGFTTVRNLGAAGFAECPKVADILHQGQPWQHFLQIVRKRFAVARTVQKAIHVVENVFFAHPCTVLFNGAFQNGRSWAFLAWAITDPQTLRAQDVYIYNNAWVANAGVGTARFSKSDAEGVGDFLLDHNLYWNGGKPIPQEDQGVINFTADAAAILADPRLPDVPDVIVLPTWDANAGIFADGSATICGAFERLVANYGQPMPGSAVIDAGVANVTSKPGDESSALDVVDDIRGRARKASPDVGAFELD